MDKKQVINQLRELQIKLSKQITRKDIEEHSQKLAWGIRKNFKTYTKAYKAAGLEINFGSNQEKSKKNKDSVVLKMIGDNAWLGKAAEHYVVAELLYLGYNATRLTMDSGLDVFAEKEGKAFYLQVKNLTYSNKNNKVDISVNSFARNNSGNTYYVIVLNDTEHQDRNVIVLPSIEILRLVKKHEQSGGSRYRLRVKRSDSEILINGIDETYFWNNWEIIR